MYTSSQPRTTFDHIRARGNKRESASKAMSSRGYIELTVQRGGGQSVDGVQGWRGHRVKRRGNKYGIFSPSSGGSLNIIHFGQRWGEGSVIRTFVQQNRRWCWWWSYKWDNPPPFPPFFSGATHKASFAAILLLIVVMAMNKFINYTFFVVVAFSDFPVETTTDIFQWRKESIFSCH